VTSAEDVTAVLENTSQRLLYVDLIESLQRNNRPALGVRMVLDEMRRDGLVRLTDPSGNEWLDQYGMEPGDRGYQDGPLYVELMGG
jgi:hypothetical protein